MLMAFQLSYVVVHKQQGLVHVSYEALGIQYIYMGFVDLGFHTEKLVQETVLLDFMLVNCFIAWIMSAQVKGIFRDMIDNSHWRVYVAKLMLNEKNLVSTNDIRAILPPRKLSSNINFLFSIQAIKLCLVCCLWFGNKHLKKSSQQ